ncbi:MAG: hypothetical protein E5X57_21945 [Mesorhizobium sp.]|uniref:hypothetical protein n=1 Tax=Mesorhizobium sp. TaxID=1871066 RepID=UPI0011FA5C1B|nr:hypothetical protein [Mesorhizobium sp.]TIQ08747.1 MAG: hypothetical protein E5X57_21945 [Mesorhizobium sp.]
MTKEQPTIRILIINNDFAETDVIKSWLEEGMRLPWTYTHCISVSEAIPRVNNSDLIILKPEMEGLSTPMQVFDSIEDIVFEVPIIVLAGKDDEHGLSTFVMEKGAADIVVRGKFERLVDAIEFALIRQKITSDTRRASDKALQNNKDQAEAELQESNDLRTKDQGEAAEKLKGSDELRIKSKQESDNILSMFMGGYSATSNDTEK